MVNPLFLPAAVLIAVLGAALGSFFNVCIYRLPRGISLLKPPSHCPVCKKHIKPWHNIPLVSWLLLGGKCRYCKAHISPRYLIVELLTPLVLLSLFFKFAAIDGNWDLNRYGLNFLFIKYALFFAVGIILFFIDARHQLLPHKITQPLIELGIILAFVPGTDVGPKSAILGGAIGFAFFAAIFIYYMVFKRKGSNDAQPEPEEAADMQDSELVEDAEWGFITYRVIRFLVRLVHKPKPKVDEPEEEVLESGGIGGGDIFLIAAVGFFMGLPGVIATIVLGSAMGLIWGVVHGLRGKNQLAFGPFLLLGSYIYVLFGHQIMAWYLTLLP